MGAIDGEDREHTHHAPQAERISRGGRRRPRQNDGLSDTFPTRYGTAANDVRSAHIQPARRAGITVKMVLEAVVQITIPATATPTAAS